MKKFPLIEYLQSIAKQGILVKGDISPSLNKEIIQKVSYNSNDVVQNTLFVCKGIGFQEAYLDQAIAKGAIAYLSEHDYQKTIPCLLVNNVQKTLSLVAQVYYNFPSKQLRLIAITGTKGKTTTANYIKFILDEYLDKNNLPKAGLITTDAVFDGQKESFSHLTTPESLDLQEIFYNAVQNKTIYMIVEVSSQALKYGRVFGIKFDLGLFLNISEDHISQVEHHDYEDYFTSKLKLFDQSSVAVVHKNTDRLEKVLQAARETTKVITFALGKEADIYGYQIKDNALRSSFMVRTKSFDQEFELVMPGIFNIENALAAIAATSAIDIPPEDMYQGLKKAVVKGRMDRYASDDGEKIVIVDYAHNKLSFERLYESIRKQYPTRKIITVFGCPGEKAIIRRKDLGGVSGLQSDFIILTMEDPGEKDIKEICEEIAHYVQENNQNFIIIEDRTEAIRQAIFSYGSDTIILVTGKGNEHYQRIGKKNIFYPSDVDNAQRFLAEYDAQKKL